mmetsp:Transcript_25833/g.83108  ORF Transcript_25833/g.83108 Transcript_25833/m.83108 type:complete len:244 (-) Transcript_25833:643-1374(-)
MQSTHHCGQQRRHTQLLHLGARAAPRWQRHRVCHHHLLQHRSLQHLACLARQDAVRCEGEDALGPVVSEHAHARDEGGPSVDHVVHEDHILPLHVAHQLHVGRRVIEIAVHAPRETAVDDGGEGDLGVQRSWLVREQPRADANLHIAGLLHTRFVRTHHDQASALAAAAVAFELVREVVHGQAGGLNVVHHDMGREEALNLAVPRRLDVHSDYAVHTHALQHHRHIGRSDGNGVAGRGTPPPR